MGKLGCTRILVSPRSKRIFKIVFCILSILPRGRIALLKKLGKKKSARWFSENEEGGVVVGRLENLSVLVKASVPNSSLFFDKCNALQWITQPCLLPWHCHSYKDGAWHQKVWEDALKVLISDLAFLHQDSARAAQTLWKSLEMTLTTLSTHHSPQHMWHVFISLNMPPVLKSKTAATMVRGPRTFVRTKTFNSRRSRGDQTTWGTNKSQGAARGRKIE